MDGHLTPFDPEVAKIGSKLVDATIELHSLVMNNLLPSAVKFHYQFNLRELSNITQGLTRMLKEYFKASKEFHPLLVEQLHQCTSVASILLV